MSSWVWMLSLLQKNTTEIQFEACDWQIRQGRKSNVFSTYLYFHIFVFTNTKMEPSLQALIDRQDWVGIQMCGTNDPGATPPRFLPLRTNVFRSRFCQREKNVIWDLGYLDIYIQDTWILFGIFTYHDCLWCTPLFKGRKHKYGSKSRCVFKPW